ncbi:MAG: T9SS type A sorting domain-containing protein [Bacteroidetes bacterium]|nr:T9SS type A sorting domain-containing protein [Bacteroidota bacterium]
MKKILFVLLFSVSIIVRAQTIDAGDTVIFDFSHATCSGNYFLVPVSFYSDDEVYAIDFSMKYDETKITYHSVIIHEPSVSASAYFNPLDSTLRFSSFSMSVLPNVTSIVSVQFDLSVSSVALSDFNTILVYLNGDSCSYKFIPPLPTAVIMPGGSLSLVPGDSVALTATPASDVTYLWSANDTNQTIYVTTAGTYSVTVTTDGGCTSMDSLTVLMITPLPVELVNFSAREENEIVFIEWTTAAEINNDHFEVEKSVDGVSWRTIGMIGGAGNSSSLLHYAFNDETPLAGFNYYRIKQIDFNGSIIYSEIVSIYYSGKEAQSSIMVFPNPASDCLNIFPGKNVTFQLIDLNGRVIDLGRMLHANEINQINIQQLDPGIYYLSVFGEDGDYLEKDVSIVVFR